MRQRFLVTLMIVIVVGACTQPGAGAGNQPRGDIRMWFASDLTGAFSELGQIGCEAAQMAASDVNQQGGISKGPHKGAHLVVQCVDDGHSPDAASTLASHWVQDPSVWTMMGFSASDAAATAAEVGGSAGLSVIGSDVGGSALTGGSVHDLFAMSPPPTALGYTWVDFCKAYYGAGAIADLSPDFTEIAEFRKGRDAAIRAEPGVRLVSEQTYPVASTTDFTLFLANVKSSGARCLLLGSFPPQQCKIVAQARQIGLKISIVDFTDSGTTASCVTAAGHAYAGMAFGDELVIPAATGSLADQVSKAFASRYSEPLSSYAANSYDGVLALKCAVEEGANLREDLATYLPKIDCAGVGGPLMFTNNRIGDRQVTITEATGQGDARDTVATYTVKADGTASRSNLVTTCAQRPSCSGML